MRRLKISILLISLALLSCGGKHGKKAVTQPSDLAAYHNNRGISYLAKNQIEQAELEFKTALELSPDYAEAYNNLGLIAKARGNFMEAERLFKTAIAKDKEYAAAYNHLGVVYLNQGRVDEAINQIKTALKKEPTFTDAMYNLGLTYLDKAKIDGSKYIDEAEREFKRVTELDPRYVPAHLQLGDIYFDKKKYEAASIRYRVATEGNPDAVEPWLRLGKTYAAMGDAAKAQNAFAKANQLGESSETSLTRIANLHLHNREWDKAIDFFTRALDLNPLSDGLWTNLGIAKFQKGNATDRPALYAEALAAFVEALKLNPNAIDAHYNSGLVYLKQGDGEKAVHAWKEAIQLSPQHAPSLFNLGLYYSTQGQPEAGNNYLCQFIKSAGRAYQTEVAAAKTRLTRGCN